MSKKKQEKKELLLEQADELRNMKLPKHWEVSKLEVTFSRRGSDMYKRANVIYDDMNHTFYVQTVKSIVYPGESKQMKEAIGVMMKANKIIKSKRTDHENDNEVY